MKRLLRAFVLLPLLLSPVSRPASASEPRRPPAVAGTFYPADPAQLSALVTADLSSAPASRLPGRLIALLAPHAGLVFSGKTAARSFSLLKKGLFDAVIVVGTGHYWAVEGAAIYPGDYGTPAGYLPYARSLARELAAVSPLFALDAAAHEREHSIEVEIPFLLSRLGKVPFLGVVMNTQDFETARKVGRTLAAAVKKSGKRVLLVASSDLSHYPPDSVDVPVDSATLTALRTLDPAYFWTANEILAGKKLQNISVTYCGLAAVTAVLTAAVDLGANQALVLDRTNSYRALPDSGEGRVVGYAAAAFIKNRRAEPYRPFAALGIGGKKSLLREARSAIASLLGKNEDSAPAARALEADPVFNLPAATFVTLTKEGRLRGCIGSLAPASTLEDSVRRNAVLAAFRDPRFQRLSKEELPEIAIEISILSRPRPVGSAAAIKPGDGVILSSDDHRGVFLPQVWEEIPDKSRFLAELCSQKAGLAPDCYKDPGVKIETFSVQSFDEGHLLESEKTETKESEKKRIETDRKRKSKRK